MDLYLTAEFYLRIFQWSFVMLTQQLLVVAQQRDDFSAYINSNVHVTWDTVLWRHEVAFPRNVVTSVKSSTQMCRSALLYVISSSAFGLKRMCRRCIAGSLQQRHKYRMQSNNILVCIRHCHTQATGAFRMGRQKSNVVQVENEYSNCQR